MNRGILLIGFSEDEVRAVRELFEFGVFEVPEYCGDWVLQEIVDKAETLSGSSHWHLRKFVIMHNLSNEEIKAVMGRIRPLIRGRGIFATTTPTSLEWKLEDLLRELMEEDEYFRAMKWAREEASKKRGPFLDIGKG